MVRIAEVDVEGLPRWLTLHNAVRHEDPLSAEMAIDWRRQSDDTIWLLATRGAVDVGAGIGVHGWHSEPGVVRALAFVPPGSRGSGVGSALLARLTAWSAAHGGHTVEGTVDEEDSESQAWLVRRGFAEVGRNSTMALDLTALDEPAVDPPAGIEIVSWSERPELARGMYQVACEALPDVPGEERTVMADFERWLSNDMQGASDRADATFVALAGDRVVGYAKLSLSPQRPDCAFHDLTGVLRAWRGRGIAGALKRAEIAWAKRNGLQRLETWNEVRNTPIRILNERHGYVVEPGSIVMRATVSAGT